MTDGVTASHQGRKLIKAFHSATERLKQAESERTRAECEVSNTRRELAKWLMPSDAKPGEKFSIWDQDMHGNECLVEVVTPDKTDTDFCEPRVVLRYRK